MNIFKQETTEKERACINGMDIAAAIEAYLKENDNSNDAFLTIIDTLKARFAANTAETMAETITPRVAETTYSETDVEIRITEIFHELGAPAHIQGYHHARKAIMLSVYDMNLLNFVTKGLYPTVAREYGTTPSRVERSIRHMVEAIWNRGNVEAINALFKYTTSVYKDKPTNSEFIALIADKVRIEMNISGIKKGNKHNG